MLLSAQGRSGSAPVHTDYMGSCVARVYMSSSVMVESQDLGTPGLRRRACDSRHYMAVPAEQGASNGSWVPPLASPCAV